MRFRGFDGDWEETKMQRIVEFKITNSFSRENLNYVAGSVKNIHYGDIHTKFQTIFDITRENLPYVNDQISLGRISDDFYCKEGDIIFADASEDLKDVGKSIEIINLNGEKVLSGLHTLLARPKANHFQKGFSGYLFRSTNVRLQIQKEAQGSKVLSINVGRLSNIVLSIPSIPEQKQVADFLSLIDERIITQNKIIEKLKTLMKGLREKLFAQKLRFKDENCWEFPEWEQKTLGDMAEIVMGQSPDGESYNVRGVGTPLINGPVEFGDKNPNRVKWTTKSTKLCMDNDILFCVRGSTTGKMNISNGIYCIGRGIAAIRSNRKSTTMFLEQQILENLNAILGLTSGSTFQNIDGKTLREFKSSYPSLKEQTKIANFLSYIDNKVDTEKRILMQYETQKNYLLQSMFV